MVMRCRARARPRATERGPASDGRSRGECDGSVQRLVPAACTSEPGVRLRCGPLFGQSSAGAELCFAGLAMKVAEALMASERTDDVGLGRGPKGRRRVMIRVGARVWIEIARVEGGKIRQRC
ncbi:BQ5605_C022g09418 [Microbotryum silenes-dioicae]|uniref:BQ5605_C022g09418 protein n=1 Tax=Microbotryum silenes-dioicae TaxID=796604 RepID=A0A2X0MNT7_9BASI|nr:BQ5605_C022g09418 [Microbotryum silenes-dioicae]